MARRNPRITFWEISQEPFLYFNAREASTSKPCTTRHAGCDKFNVRMPDLLPSHLPHRAGWGACAAIKSRRVRSRLRDYQCAVLIAELQTALFGFLSLSGPKDLCSLPCKLGPYRTSGPQRQAFDGLVFDNLHFCRARPTRSVGPGRGQNNLLEMVTAFETRCLSHSECLESGCFSGLC